MATNQIEYKNDGVYYNGTKVGGGSFTYINQSSNYTLTTDDCDGTKRFHNNGATGDIIYTLPAAQAGLEVTIVNTETYNLKVEQNGSDKIFTPKYKYGVDYVDLKQSVSTTFYSTTAGRWEAKNDLSTLWGQVEKLVASDGVASDFFGFATCVSGDYAIVGAFGDDDLGSTSGSAYIFHRLSGGDWDSGVKIIAPDGVADDHFGYSVSICENFAVVGSYYDSNGNGGMAGSVYVFHRVNKNEWGGGVKITASDGSFNDYFGYSVSISKDYLVVGAPHDNGNSGSAYIYQRTGDNTWGNEFKIVASDAASNDYFGLSASLSGDYVAIGAYQDDDNGSNAGSAYIYQRTGNNTWGNEFKIVASDGAVDDMFGISVSISGDYFAAGAPFKDSSKGSAYVYQRTGDNTWGNEAVINYSGGATNDGFGRSVSISNEYLVVGANTDNSAHVFRRTGGNIWDSGTKLVATDSTGSFGISSSISDSTIIVGAYTLGPGSICVFDLS